ncbi:WYL domain-containing protein [Patescibacteria group bacterium]|jgi:predicted DNA-binding transcriptional regulator YafY|nr:WYL domain-containing protein [Patescibacteria group bacterium]
MTNLAPVVFFYKNHRGEIEERHVVPESIEFSLVYHGDYHPQPGWYLNGFDLDRQARRSFLLANIALPLTVAIGEFGKKIESYGSLRLDFKPAATAKPEEHS